MPLVPSTSRRFAAALAVAVAPLLTGAAPTTAPTQTPFVTVVLRDWAKWDVDNDGKITLDEINRAVADSKMTGDDGLATAAMKMVVRSKTGKDLLPLTKAYFEEYNTKAMPVLAKLTPEAAPRAADGGIDTPAAPTTAPAANASGPRTRLPNWDTDFKVSQRAMTANGNGDAWQPPVIGSDLTHLHQSATMGDCWLVASVGSLTVHRPDALKQLVQVEPDGSCTVTLHGAKPIHLPPLTDAQRAMGGTSVGDGAWLAVIEQALGRAQSVKHGGSVDIDGNDQIIGGDSQVALGYLTGHKIYRISFPKTVTARAAEKDKYLADARQQLLKAVAEHRGITAGIDPPRMAKDEMATAGLPKIPPGFGIHHVYAIVDFDPKTDLITIWNPWGQTRKPKGPDGLENGYNTDHGRFTLPLTEAYAFYTSFTFEQDVPTTKPAGLTRAD